MPSHSHECEFTLHPDFTEALVLTVEGEVGHGLDCTNRLEQALQDALAHPSTVLVDLSGTSFIDSAGLRVLHRACRTARERNVTLVCVCPEASHVHRVINLVGMDQELNVVPSLADGIAYCRSG